MPLFKIERSTDSPVLVEAKDVLEAIRAYLADGSRSAEYVTSITVLFHGSVVRLNSEEYSK